MHYHKSLPTFGESVLSGILLASSGCSLDAPPSAFPELAERLFTPVELSGVLVFTPAPEWLEETEKAAARWSAATGTDISVGPQGLPVLSRYALVDYMGKQTAGGTLRDGVGGECRGLVLDPVRAYPPFVIPHEMGHCLGAREHTASGIMNTSGANLIDNASLEAVCLEWECGVMTPEG